MAPVAAPILDRLPPGSRVVVIRLRSLGDCVLTTPALALLKAHRPDLHIAVVVEDRFRQIFEGNPDIDEILPPTLRAARGARLVLNLHGGTRSMWMTAASLAPLRAGFSHHSGAVIYSAKIPTAQEILGMPRRVHTAEHLASAVFWLGVPMAEIPRAKLVAPPNPPISPNLHNGLGHSGAGPWPAAGSQPAQTVQQQNEPNEVARALGLPRRDSSRRVSPPSFTPQQNEPNTPALLHPFASAPSKAWPPDRFVTIAQHLRASGLEPTILAGPADDPAPFADFPVLRNAPLSAVKAAASQAQLFVGNDSGPAHIAAAFGVPVVVLFGPSDPVTWAPWRTESQVLTSPGAITNITVDQVLAAIDHLRVRACPKVDQ